MLKKILALFDLYESFLGIKVAEDEIYFIKIRHTFKGLKILKELRVLDQKLSEVIKETIRENNLKYRYYSMQYDMKNVRVKCIDILAIALPHILQYLEQHLELYLPLKLRTDDCQYNFIVQKERPLHLRLLSFVFKWDSLKSLFTDLRAFSYLSFITLKDMNVIFLFPYIYHSFSGYHLHFRKEHVLKLVYYLGYLNLFHYFPSTPERYNWFPPNEPQKPIILSGKEPVAEILTTVHLRIFSFQKIIRGYQREYPNALDSSLLVLFMEIIVGNAYRFFLEKEFFIQKRKSILFIIIWLLYFLGIVIVFIAQLIQSGLETSLRFSKPNMVKHQSLIQRRDLLLSQQHQFKNIWLSYLRHQEVKNKISRELCILLKSIPLPVKISHLKFETQKNNSSMIHLREYCLTQKS